MYFNCFSIYVKSILKSTAQVNAGTCHLANFLASIDGEHGDITRHEMGDPTQLVC